MLSLAHQVPAHLDRAPGLYLLSHPRLVYEDAEDVLDLSGYRIRRGQTVLCPPVIEAADLPASG